MFKKLFSNFSNKNQFTNERLLQLNQILEKNEIVNENNFELIIETIRNLGEFIIYADQKDDRVYE
jgi:hypothetical protein